MVLAEQIGNEFQKLRDERKEEREAIKFCREYARERKWCFENGIDFRKVKEEDKFQELILKFNFRERKDQI